VVEMNKVYRRLGWALEILEDANKGMKKLVLTSPNCISKAIVENRTQIDSARTIIKEIIEEYKKEKNESTPSNRK
jgi:hypothetical protein